MQDVTQEGVARAANGDITGLLDQMGLSFIGNILGGFRNIVGAIESAINQLVSALVYGLRGITGGLVDLTFLLKKTSNTAEDALSTTVNTGVVVQQIVTNVEIISAPISESWETMIPGQQVSFPRALLNANVKAMYDSGNNSNPGGMYENYILISDSQDANVWIRYSRLPRYFPAINTVEAAFIRSNYAVGRAVVNFAVGPTASGSPASQLLVYIGRMDKDGNVKIEWISGNQSPLMANATLEWQVTLPEQTAIQFDIGEYMVVMVHQYGTGSPRALLCNEMTTLSQPNEVFPPQQKFAVTGATSSLVPNQVIPKSQLNFTSNNLPWVAIGQRLFTGDPPKRLWFDDFNRGSVGAKWSSVGDKPMYIYNGELSYVREAFAANGTARILYSQPLAYDDQRITGTVSGNGVGDVTSEPAKLVYRSNASGLTFCSLDVRRDNVTWARMVNNSPIALGSFNINSSIDDKWKVEVVGGIHKAFKKTRGTSDWVYVFEYPESTPSSGPEYRYTGMSVQRFSFTSSGGWKDYEAEDLVN